MKKLSVVLFIALSVCLIGAFKLKNDIRVLDGQISVLKGMARTGAIERPPRQDGWIELKLSDAPKSSDYTTRISWSFCYPQIRVIPLEVIYDRNDLLKSVRVLGITWKKSHPWTLFEPKIDKATDWSEML